MAEPNWDFATDEMRRSAISQDDEISRIRALNAELVAALEAALPVVETDALRLIAAVDYNSEEAEGHLEGATTLADQVRATLAKARGE